jgi:hypothetical protein
MRLQLARLPDQAARQLPDQSTTLRVAPSSTGDTRLRGALDNRHKKVFPKSVLTKPETSRPIKTCNISVDQATE